MSDDEPDVFDDYERAEEDGHALGDYISSLDGESHREHPDRNRDGTFRRTRARRRNDRRRVGTAGPAGRDTPDRRRTPDDRAASPGPVPGHATITTPRLRWDRPGAGDLPVRGAGQGVTAAA